MSDEQAQSYKRVKHKHAKKYDYCSTAKGGWRYMQITKMPDMEECWLDIDLMDAKNRIKMNDLAMIALYNMVEDFLKHKNYLPNLGEAK